MARYNGLIIPRSYNDYYSRSDPQAIRDIVALSADGELNAESKNPLQNQAIAKIVPNTASETNELADKNFVNSTVGTNTANYIYKTESGGEKVPFSSVAELEAYAGTVTNNDYAFVTGIDENGNAYYDRYKANVNDGVVTWAKEYRLNNSSFTAEQWAAIQSGITAEKVAQFEGAVSPVDIVQSGNMSAVTSNAVNGALANYINKTDATTLQQALQLPGVLSGAVAAGDNKAVKSAAVAKALDVIYEDITSECLAINDSITVTNVYGYRQGNHVALTFHATTKGYGYGIVRIPQRYTPRSGDFAHQWWNYSINNRTVTGTVNNGSEFYLLFDTVVPAGISFSQTFCYFI